MGEKLITFVFVVESCKGMIDVSIMHKRFVDSFEKQSFVISDKNVGKRWAKRRTHSNAINLSVHYIIETEFNGGSSRLHQLNKNCTRKRRRSKFVIIQSISADFNGFREWNISKKAADVIGAKKDRWKKVKSSDLVSKSKGIGNTVSRKSKRTGSITDVNHWAD